MSRNGTLGYIYNNKEYLGYNHWDSYPSGLGVDVLIFIEKINKENGWIKFKEFASKLNNLGDNEVTDILIQKKYEKYSDLGCSEEKLSDPYCLFRKIQGVPWLEELYNGELQDYTLCNKKNEYTYLINLDTIKLEFFIEDEMMAVFDLYLIADAHKSNDVFEKMIEVSGSGISDSSVNIYRRKYDRKLKLNAINLV